MAIINSNNQWLQSIATSMATINGSNHWQQSMATINGNNQWQQSMATINGNN